MADHVQFEMVVQAERGFVAAIRRAARRCAVADAS